MKAMKRITSMILSVCMLLGLIFVPAQAQQTGDNGSGFRGNAYNNGITTARTPHTKEGSGLLWEQRLVGYAGPPMYANGSIYTYSGNVIYKLNKNTGEVEGKQTMAFDAGQQAFGWTYFPVTYGDGKVYVAFGAGKIQAFDADTLESQWVYESETVSKDPYANAYSPITYKDGKIYVGFVGNDTDDPWDPSTKAEFVCLSADNGNLEWSTGTNLPEDGGFNWNGAAVVGDYVIYANAKGSIVSRNTTEKGKEVSRLETGSAKIRSSVTYDNGKIYCMTKDAKLVIANVNLSNGELSIWKTIDCSKYGPESKSTPVVYNGIVYVGVGKYGEGKVIAINPAEEKILWSEDVTSYPEGAMLLSNTYEKEGSLYLYATYNGMPGGIDAIKISADGSKAEEYELFGALHKGYCQSCIVADEEGTLYYKNDSGYIMAIAAEDKMAAIELENTIAGIPDEKDISLKDEKDIEAVRAAYEALTKEQKELVSEESIQTLEKAEAKIALLKVEKTLDELPSAEKVTLENEKEVAEARKQYDTLTRQQKKELSSESVLNFFDAEKKIAQLKDAAEKEAKAEASAKDVQAAEAVEKQIMAIGTVTLSKTEEVKAAKAAYDKLTKEQKQLVSAEAVVTLKEAIAASNKCISDEVEKAKKEAEAEKAAKAEKAEKAAKAEASAKNVQAAEKVEKQIMAIGTVTLSKADKVKAVKAAYDKLTKEQKKLVSVEAIVTLREAVAAGNKYIKDTKTNAYYKVTKAGKNGKVSYIKPITKEVSAVIPAQITAAGRTYKVTAISARAFKKNTTVQKVVIGRNISKIGKEAFYRCKNLKKIQIKSKKLSAKNVGNRAFKGINKNAKMSVPKNKVKSYAKWVKTKGSRRIKVTK